MTEITQDDIDKNTFSCTDDGTCKNCGHPEYERHMMISGYLTCVDDVALERIKKEAQ